jgi:hypothetical protein
LKKLDDRLDHLVSREQLIVVVIGVGQEEERLRSDCGFVQAATILDGDISPIDGIATV